MSDEIVGELTKMVESQVAERLGENQLEELAQQAGLGDADGLLSNVTSLFGGHAARPQAEAEPGEGEEPAEEAAEPENEGDNEE